MMYLDTDLPAAAAAGGSPLWHVVDQLLRDGRATLARIARGDDLALIARAAIATIAVGGGLFGAAMGAHRGELQILYAGVKLPLAMLLTTAICAPALTSLNAAVGRAADLRRDLALVLSALARASLVLGALAPVVLLAVRLGVGYHGLTLLVVACCSLGGAVGLAQLMRGLGDGQAEPLGSGGQGARRRGAASVALALLVVFGLVGTQMAWTLRPFLLRPRTPEVPVLRSVEGSFLAAVLVSLDSARGIYWRPAAPLPEEDAGR